MTTILTYRQPKSADIPRGTTQRLRSYSRSTQSPSRPGPIPVQRRRHLSISERLELLVFEKLPSWYQDNVYVKTGYRPISNSVNACFKSWSYWHNETLNIYTHLIPAVLFLLGQYIVQVMITNRFPQATTLDRAVFSVNLFAAFMTMMLSSVYLTLVSHSRPMARLWLHIDYTGILTLIVGSFFSAIYVGFYCEPVARLVHWTSIIVLSCATAVIVLHPKFDGLSYRPLRTYAFIATAGSGLSPIFHGIYIYGWEEMWVRSGMPYYFLEGIIYGIGSVFFLTRFPESTFPKRFDIYCSSHQIFHILVVIAALAHMYGVWEAFAWNYENNRVCPVRN